MKAEKVLRSTEDAPQRGWHIDAQVVYDWDSCSVWVATRPRHSFGEPPYSVEEIAVEVQSLQLLQFGDYAADVVHRHVVDVVLSQR